MNTPLGKTGNNKQNKSIILSGNCINDISPLQLFLSNSFTPFLKNKSYNNFLSDIKTPFKKSVFSITKNIKSRNTRKENNTFQDENKEKSITKLNLNFKREYRANNLSISVSNNPNYLFLKEINDNKNDVERILTEGIVSIKETNNLKDVLYEEWIKKKKIMFSVNREEDIENNDLEKKLNEIIDSHENIDSLDIHDNSTQCKSTKRFLKRIRLRKNI